MKRSASRLSGKWWYGDKARSSGRSLGYSKVQKANMLPSILILGGGPDSEREVSLRSARAIEMALKASGYTVVNQTIHRVTSDELRAMPGEVIFPILHGGWGEGGPLQEILEADGRPFVGSRAKAARHAMDKIATKFTAVELGIPTPPVHVLDMRDEACPFDFPVVVKPVHDGSTVGLHVCRSQAEWMNARRVISDGPTRAYMVERCICRENGRKARELTVGILDDQALPVIEITPAIELYDYEAKYNRNDTRYDVSPALPAGVTEQIQRQTIDLARALGVRHMARADFMLDDRGVAWLLEINTHPGFTDHSLVPKAAGSIGLEMPALCAQLVGLGVRDAGEIRAGGNTNQEKYPTHLAGAR